MQEVVLGAGIQCIRMLPLHTSLLMQTHTRAQAHTCSWMSRRPKAVTGLLSCLWFHRAFLGAGGGGAMRGEQRQVTLPSTPPHLNSSRITLGSILAWRESTELVEIISPQGEGSSQAQRSGLRIQPAWCPWDVGRADRSQAARHSSHWQTGEPGGHGERTYTRQTSVQNGGSE